MIDETKAIDKQTGEVTAIADAETIGGPLRVIPTPQESLALYKVAGHLWKSGLFPAVKSAEGAYAIVEYGRELGIGPMAALQSIDLIMGKPRCSAQLMLALAVKGGVRYQIRERSEVRCVIDFDRNGSQLRSSFTMDQARAAKLIKQDSGWTKYPEDMLFWRAVTRGCRSIAPDIVTGLVAAEEMEDEDFGFPANRVTVQRASVDLDNIKPGDPETHQGHELPEEDKKDENEFQPPADRKLL